MNIPFPAFESNNKIESIIGQRGLAILSLEVYHLFIPHFLSDLFSVKNIAKDGPIAIAVRAGISESISFSSRMGSSNTCYAEHAHSGNLTTYSAFTKKAKRLLPFYAPSPSNVVLWSVGVEIWFSALFQFLSYRLEMGNLTYFASMPSQRGLTVCLNLVGPTAY
jgi:peptidoglycan/LPS O-acetylase OafA/YrhL